MFDFVYESLDQIAAAVDREINNARHADIALAWNMSSGSTGLYQIDDDLSKEASICDDVASQR